MSLHTKIEWIAAGSLTLSWLYLAFLPWHPYVNDWPTHTHAAIVITLFLLSCLLFLLIWPAYH